MAETPAYFTKLSALRTRSHCRGAGQPGPASSVLGLDAAGIVRFVPSAVAQLTGHAPADFPGREFNAVKFSPSGGRIVSGASHAPCRSITTSVCDTGVGIATLDQKSVFKPFARANNEEVSRKERGLRLGLAFVKRLAEAHGAAVKPDSIPGKGPDARIILPEWWGMAATQEIAGLGCHCDAVSLVPDDVDYPSR